MMPNGTKRRRYTLACVNAVLDGRRIIQQTHNKRSQKQISISVENGKDKKAFLTMVCQWPYGSDDGMFGSYREIDLERAMKLIEEHFP